MSRMVKHRKKPNYKGVSPKGIGSHTLTPATLWTHKIHRENGKDVRIARTDVQISTGRNGQTYYSFGHRALSEPVG